MFERKFKILILLLLLANAKGYSVRSDNGKMFYDNKYNELYDDYVNIEKRTPSIYVIRRSCIRRGGICDNRPHDCCHSSSCRCNLWGSNCRCQRMGLFQKWG